MCRRGGQHPRAAVGVADALDDLLSPDLAARLRRHLDGCADCSEYLAQLRIVRGLARRDAGGSLDDATRGALSDLYRDWRGG